MNDRLARGAPSRNSFFVQKAAHNPGRDGMAHRMGRLWHARMPVARIVMVWYATMLKAAATITEGAAAVQSVELRCGLVVELWRRSRKAGALGAMRAPQFGAFQAMKKNRVSNMRGLCNAYMQ